MIPDRAVLAQLLQGLPGHFLKANTVNFFRQKRNKQACRTGVFGSRAAPNVVRHNQQVADEVVCAYMLRRRRRRQRR